MEKQRNRSKVQCRAEINMEIIADTVRRLALKPIDAETVMAALEDMGRALDQLEPSSSNDQRGMAPREFH